MVFFVVLMYTFQAISIFCDTVLLCMFLKIDIVKQHPGSLILGQCISQFFIDTNNFMFKSDLDTLVCSFVGAVAVSSAILGWNYTLFLSYEVIKIIEDPYNNKYQKRIKFYHFVFISPFL